MTELEELLDSGKHILQELENAQPEDRLRAFRHAKEEEENWSLRISAMAADCFTDDAITSQYQALPLEPLTEQVGYALPKLKANINRKLEWLTNLKEQTNSLRESETAPTADFTSESGR